MCDAWQRHCRARASHARPPFHAAPSRTFSAIGRVSCPAAEQIVHPVRGRVEMSADGHLAVEAGVDLGEVQRTNATQVHCGREGRVGSAGPQRVHVSTHRAAGISLNGCSPNATLRRDRPGKRRRLRKVSAMPLSPAWGPPAMNRLRKSRRPRCHDPRTGPRRSPSRRDDGVALAMSATSAGGLAEAAEGLSFFSTRRTRTRPCGGSPRPSVSGASSARASRPMRPVSFITALGDDCYDRRRLPCEAAATRSGQRGSRSGVGLQHLDVSPRRNSGGAVWLASTTRRPRSATNTAFVGTPRTRGVMGLLLSRLLSGRGVRLLPGC